MDAPAGVLVFARSCAGAGDNGLRMPTCSAGPMPSAPYCNSGPIAVFEGNLHAVNLAGAFQDSGIPAGFAPFNIQNLGGTLYVTYARQDAAKHNDVAGKREGNDRDHELCDGFCSRPASRRAVEPPLGGET